MRNKVYIIHGFGADSTSNFFPWLKQKLKTINIDCDVLDLPNTYNPKLNEWLLCMNKKIKEVNDNVYLVGHSLGCISILKFLNQLKVDTKVGGILLVSGFDDSLPLFPILNSFVDKKIDYLKIKAMTKKICVIASKDDELVPIEYSQQLAKNLKAKFIKLNGYGHFLVFDLPIALEILKKWIL